ncbi:aldo/keto reductase [bacterium (Candidatus Blackallbacteria) CG17_big_fil_post_rev_8_21_14_2_50_48_46]|uniref:Aldo/keto reductase n=1 Tax=bacterium (Candidatus Blackallbacteria) CG17_big_fil_post_rev_8_21_14_2_50_48_46 TaxID=2014261 RepID=A0A2M7G6D2_9BACT|nr:MAG: aldo/keto reductase [bacterium (Candidatus Blackallbacteria) CG18_big_fil_WC_8_21_14_2_50_49_26]PIW17190.1 MAG: aldo/keto reductase [bacterium (Candidatus Blackallbacteria) CG17_big_fil_post_rev_8_21_14_2_50_48_46]PIW50981.1 MAG: aldo/keto reductase [bacterium (Candidatus Blackallbacteria) CG13_big_fil_rev_8_21_14_2_50_49_14]
MIKRAFGNSGLQVSALGFGAGHIGGNELSDREAEALLNHVLDSGINLIDTARGYGASETRIGKFLQHKRSDLILSTKIGYGIEGIPDWTAACIEAGIDEALKNLKTDWLDIVHLHSCPIGTLEYGEVIAALAKAKQAGKVRLMAYSGENQALEWAIHAGVFDSIQCSVNICDRYSLQHLLPIAKAKGLGVIAKRPLANAFWRFQTRPYGDYCENYWLRWQAMGMKPEQITTDQALRFTAFADGVDTCIAGTRQIKNLSELSQALEKGPLPADLLSGWAQSYKAHGNHWVGEV